ncbi:MAG: methyltransferase domain-containing protein [Castellaniella sp.]
MLKNFSASTWPLLQNLRQYQASALRLLRKARSGPAASLFLKEWLVRPGEVGAVWPSSGQLARLMAAQISQTGDGLIVELGAGTGVVTQALLDAGVPANRLWVVEQSPAFVQHLRHRFPALTVVGGDAADLQALLPANMHVDAIVSSLPLRSLPANTVADVVLQWRACLSPGANVVQFTYALWGAQEALADGFSQKSVRYAWLNVPPARVCCYRREQADIGLPQMGRLPD